jgi:hypothetical protein
VPNELAKKGAQPSKPTRYGVLWIDTFYDGVVTQRNPLRGNAPHIEAEYYGSRADTAISGLNSEISTKLTFIRRPGTSVYNNQTFPGINRYYAFSPVINNQEQIRVIADVQGTAAPHGTRLVTATESLRLVIGYTPLHQPIFRYFAIVTFSTNVPATVSGQTYSFSGLTNYTALNGQVLGPTTPPSGSGITLGANQAMFQFGTFNFFTSPDTGQAVITPIPGLGGTVRDVTGPSTNQILWNKNPDAKVTSFQGVGNTLYFSDGVSTNQLIESPLIWKANTAFTSGQYIVDPNGNLQLNIGSQTGNIADIQIASGTATIFLGTGTSLEIPVGTKVTLSGLTTVPALNGTTQTSTGNSNSQQVQFANGGTQAFAAETGQITTGSGTTGAAQPTWSTVLHAITQDGGAQWENLGSQVEPWGIPTPTVTPTVTQAPSPAVYPAWGASTWYAPLFVILDSNSNLQKLISTGSAPHQTGGSAPTWNTIIGGTTADGDVTWSCIGPGTWLTGHTYVAGDILAVTFTYYITTSEQNGTDEFGNPVFVTFQQAVTVDCLFQCTIGGTSGTTFPNWTNGVGTTTIDNTVVWVNQSGPSLSPWPGSTQTLSLATAILDSNNAVEKTTILGESGTTAPTWATAVGAYTTDSTELWLNSGPFGEANTGAWIYAYSYKNSITGHIGTASQESAPILVSADNLAIIQGAGSSATQIDTIVIWRTVQGGSVLFFLDEIPNPGGGATWTYTDTTPDTGLNELIEAPIDGINDPPPTGLLALTYHLGRIWGAVNNLVYFSTGPDVTAGNGNEAWSASNVFAFPETVTRLFPTSSGLLVFTISDIFIIQGLGTPTSAFFSAPFLTDIGLVSYDAFSVNGSIVYLYSSDNQVLTLDPSSGVSEIGFPIGDQFGPGLGTGTFTPSSTFISWHVAGSQDKGLYVSDFNGVWWRMTPTPSPETGTTWSPKAQIVGGFSAVQSIEVLPGTHELLLGPQTSGPILKRDYTVSTDNGSAYPAWATLGSIVIAQPGQLGTIESFTSDSKAIGTPISLAIQLDEIAPYFGINFITPNNAGAGYTVGDIVAVVYPGGTGGLAKVTSVSGGPTGPVTGLSLLLPGEGYPATGTALATTGGTGQALSVNITSVSYFEPLTLYVQDPTELEPSVSTYAQRFYVSQTQLPAKCRHLQVMVNWGSDTVKNELLSLSLFGGFDQEK